MKNKISILAAALVLPVCMYSQVGILTDKPHSTLDLGTKIGSSVTDGAGKKLAIYNNTNGTDFYGLGVSPNFLQFYVNSAPANTLPAMILKKYQTDFHQLGINTTNPHNVIDLGPTMGNIADPLSKKLAVYNSADGNDFYGLGVSPSVLQFHAGTVSDQAPAMIVKKYKTNFYQLGINTTNPHNVIDMGPTMGNIADPDSKKLAVYNSADGNDFYGLGVSSSVLQFHAGTVSNQAPNMVLKKYQDNIHQLGINTTNPHNIIDLGPTMGGIADPLSKKLAIFNSADGNDFYGLGVSPGTLQFHAGTVNNQAPHMVLQDNGRLGIGTSAPTSTLSVNGTADKPGGGSWETFSDRRVKKDIKDFKDGLNIINQLKPVSYKYNEKSGYKDLNKEYVGFIAQDVEKVAPYMINVIDDTAKSGLPDKRELNESALTKILVNAIQQQQLEIDELKKEISEIKKHN
ncbi:tail fiber domain-containing protein [Chryseobacterium lathyri]|uniref:Peptidase S74 domain-containing protein n=1 Tax=Chryseobacterium lathyri TaxID=395933 RepID=A0ABT9SNY3_9FLAO|nr:tail fiber domain-containing protein [Chryseobacterium lathyri]MDP9961163.1 hypothetical protein [Chryseobacterium lathyri]